MSNALPAFHAVTECDSTSAFFGVGKQKAYKIVKGSDRYQKALKKIGEVFDFDKKLFPTVQKMVAKLYGVKSCQNNNEARYRKFFNKSKIPEPHKPPHTKDELLLDCKRANYVTCIWKSALSCS